VCSRAWTLRQLKDWRWLNREHVKAMGRARQRAHSERLAAIKLASGCVDCGYNDHPAALDFDHVHGEKTFALSTAMSSSDETIRREAAKCEVVCANCHRVRTFERRRAGSPYPIRDS